MQHLHFSAGQFIALMCLYTVGLVILITIVARGMRSTKAKYLLADRKVGLLMGAISISCAWAWAPAFFVSSQMTYLNGWVGLVWFVAFNAGSFLIFAPMADRFRTMLPKGYTFSGYMRERFSPRVQNLFLVSHAMLAIAAFAVQLLAGAPIIEKLSGGAISFGMATVIFAVVPIAYTMYAGYYAPVITDTVKGIIIATIGAIVLPWVIHEAGGWSTVLKGIHGVKATSTGNPWQEFFTGNGLAVMLGFGISATLGWIPGQSGDPYYWQTAQALSPKAVKWTFVLAAPLFAMIPVSLSLLGFVAGGMGLHVDPKDVQMVNIEVVGALLPTWAGYLFIFLLISALISTLDTHLAALASLFGHDVYNRRTAGLELSHQDREKGSVRYAWQSMPILVLTGLVIANGTHYVLAQQPGTTIMWLFLCYGALRAATFLPTVFSLYRKDVTESGMFWGILISLCVGLPIFFYGNLDNINWAKIAGSLIAMLGSGAIVYLMRKRPVLAMC